MILLLVIPYYRWKFRPSQTSLRETAMQYYFVHENVCRPLGVMIGLPGCNQQKLCMVLPRMKYRSVADIPQLFNDAPHRKVGCFEHRIVCLLFRLCLKHSLARDPALRVASALSYLHSQSIVHCDLHAVRDYK